MNRDSYASWRAASPPEMFGEPDDEPTPVKPSREPVWYAAEWYAPVAFRDVDTGELTTITAPVRRYFDGTTHAHPLRAAERWGRLMAGRHGYAFLIFGVDDSQHSIPIKTDHSSSA